jgi:hypothetical protein
VLHNQSALFLNIQKPKQTQRAVPLLILLQTTQLNPRVVFFESNPPVTLHNGTQLSELLPDVFVVVFDPVLVHRKFVMMS